MSTVSVKVPFDELMEVIERYLLAKHLVKSTEFLLYADLGISVDIDGMVNLDLEVEEDDTPDLLEEQLGNNVQEVDFSRKVSVNHDNDNREEDVLDEL